MQIQFIYFSKLMFILFMFLGLLYYWFSGGVYPSHTLREDYLWIFAVLLFFIVEAFIERGKDGKGFLYKVIDYSVIILLIIFLITTIL